ncbi:hypothetical protein CLV91_1861 [Maribacter vaceletii]|uniref:Uncharacterized protein n=1 Tax=Maribacter vaceletii TaxID=1206816 RepID=A0A495E8L3_9FLAO|nr:hypothetical protein [Maribacter vaceletii]RKR13146.1 hypothetical protein CLV91_1861 [Maribacter vaceletii]
MLLRKVFKEGKNTLSVENYILKIERSYKKNLELKKRLNNYAFEPRTYALHQELDKIKLRLELLQISHLKLINTLKKPINFIEVYEQKVNKQLAESRLLDSYVKDYVIASKKTS